MPYFVQEQVPQVLLIPPLLITKSWHSTYLGLKTWLGGGRGRDIYIYKACKWLILLYPKNLHL